MVVASGLVIAILLPAGCSTPERPPAAASNEDFSGTAVAGGTFDDRWASITLDDARRSEIRTILAEAAQDPGAVEPLTPAPHGVRFEDIPRAMVNAAPKVEMAILRTEHLPPTIEIDVRDAAGRLATVKVRCRARGPLTSMAYRIPGSDVALERGELLAAVDAALFGQPDGADPADLVDPLVQALVDHGARIDDRRLLPERYRFTLLMLDEQEAVLEIRREPAPTIVSWTATAGTFPRPGIAQRLGETFMNCLRAWGEVPGPASEDRVRKATGAEAASDFTPTPDAARAETASAEE